MAETEELVLDPQFYIHHLIMQITSLPPEQTSYLPILVDKLARFMIADNYIGEEDYKGMLTDAWEKVKGMNIPENLKQVFRWNLVLQYLLEVLFSTRASEEPAQI